ncbi:uncharacterized protein BDZ83DRAFT_619688, partial [Colletotrichum acutatum]
MKHSRQAWRRYRARPVQRSSHAPRPLEPARIMILLMICSRFCARACGCASDCNMILSRAARL